MKKNINIIFFIISICCLIYIGIIIYRYKQKIILEELFTIVENLDNPLQNIITEPSEPTADDIKKPSYLDLKKIDIQSIQDYVVRTVTNALASVRPDVQGPSGVIGPQGPPGQNGGTYTYLGPLRSIKEPKLFIDRKTNKLFINNQTYNTQQTWLMSSDNKIMNLANKNECIDIDSNKNLGIGPCINSEKWNFIELTGQLKLVKPIDGKNKCITLEPAQKNGDYDILLKDCSIGGTTQTWNFI